MPPDTAGDAWRAAAELPDRPGPADLSRLRATDRTITTEQWGHIVAQTLLRRRALPKLGAGDWWLTESGLQQASRPVVAMRRAKALATQGMTHWIDLGCGVGIDSIAAARAGLQVTAVERDPDTADAAEHNLATFSPTADATVVIADAMTFPVPPQAVAFVDPARRSGARKDGSAVRVAAPEQWQPPWSWVEDFVAGHDRTVAKVAPGIDRDLPGEAAALEWVSVAGDLVEATVWFSGVRAGRPRRTATLLTPNRDDPWQEAEERQLTGTGVPAPVGPVAQWLVEPDPAVIRSGLVGELADLVHGHTLSPGIAYLGCDNRPQSGWGRVSRVLAELPARPKQLRAELRRRGVGPVEIRTRGLDLDPSDLRRHLDPIPGGEPASIVVTRVAGQARTLLVSDSSVPGGTVSAP